MCDGTKVGDPNDFQHLNDMTQVEVPSSTMVWKILLPWDVHVTLIWKETLEGILQVDWSKSNVMNVASDGSTALVEDNSSFLCVVQYCNTSMEHHPWAISSTTFSLWAARALGLCIFQHRSPLGGCGTMSMVGFSMVIEPLGCASNWSTVLGETS